MRLLLILIGMAAAVPAAALDPTLAERITTESERLAPKLIECRRWFHRHPELSNREHQTAAEIARRLRELGLEPRTGIAGTGAVVVVEGARPGPVVAWRSDIDALPIEEAVDVPWRSEAPGVMHACGHDVHLTSRAVASLEGVLGPAAVRRTEPIMAAEDFSELARVVPGFYFFLGVGNQAEGWTSYLHDPTFQPDEQSITVGVRAAAALLLGELEAGRTGP